MAIGSLAGNVSVSASSSRSFRCVISAEGGFWVFVEVIMASEPFFVFFVYWMFALATKRGVASPKRGPTCVIHNGSNAPMPAPAVAAAMPFKPADGEPA
jgi:hypothetical protein